MSLHDSVLKGALVVDIVRKIMIMIVVLSIIYYRMIIHIIIENELAVAMRETVL